MEKLHVSPELTLTVKCRGHKYFGEGDLDGGISWLVLDPAECTGMSDDELVCALGMERYYGGPGQPFGDAGHVLRTNTRVLVTQRCGLDV